MQQAIIEVKSDGVSYSAITDKIVAFRKLFDPVQCTTPLQARPIVFYCDGMSRSRLESYRLRLATDGYSDALITNDLRGLVGMVFPI